MKYIIVVNGKRIKTYKNRLCAFRTAERLFLKTKKVTILHYNS